MAWRLNTALTNWRAAVDRAYPNRDRTSDGTIGDPAHQQTDSDHNEDPDGTVDAWDMDIDLRSGNDPAAVEALKDVFEQHPAARYWIHNRQIAHRRDGWIRHPYDGPNPHDKHVHWNSNEATEDSTAPWILEDDMAFEAAQEKQLAYTDVREEAWAKGSETIRKTAVATAGGTHWGVVTMAGVARTVAQLAADVAELKARPVPGTVVVEQAQLEAALRAVLGSVDGATPPQA